MSVISIGDRRRRGDSRGEGLSSSSMATEGLRPPPPGVRAIGIDLGTTNTVVSVFSDGENAPVTLEFEGHKTVPSVVAWNPESGIEEAGRCVLRHSESNPQEIIRSAKRQMGVSNKDSGRLQNLESFGHAFTAESAAAAVLRHVSEHPVLQEEKEKWNGLWAVITVPAHFDDAARRATLDAARRAEIEVLRIINEPTAAALAYSFLNEPSNPLPENEDLVVFDLGGGTFDVSVVHREELVFNVLASEGDVALGGDDLDDLLAERLLEQVNPPFLARRTQRGSELYQHLLQLARRVKHELDEIGEVQVKESWERGELHTTVLRDEFEELAHPTLERTLLLTEQAIHTARRRARDVSRILLVGGSTRLPLVRKVLESSFSQCFVDSRLEPDLAVSWGAALQAAIILGIAPETVLVDVCNHSLGIGVVDDSESISEHYRQVQQEFGLSGDLDEDELKEKLGPKIVAFNRELQKLLKVAPIIRRNSPLPARKSEFFSTLYENQPAVHVIVAQGEGPSVGENRFIGSFLFDLIQPCPKGSKCEIQLTYDVNGMVNLFARQLGTSNEAVAQFDSRTGEVGRWESLRDRRKPNGKLQSESKDGSKTAQSQGHETDLAQNVHRLNFEKGNEKLAAADAEGTELLTDSSATVLNAILARGKRVMKLSSVSDSERNDLKAWMQTYQRLLNSALEGADNDAEVEEVEEKLLEIFEKLER